MKRIINIFLLVVIFTLTNVSCEEFIESQKNVSFGNAMMWRSTWLDQPSCNLPCWQDITPGVTTREDALSVLENMPEVKIIYNKNDGLTWYFGKDTEGGNIKFSETGIVSNIWLSSTISDLQLENIVEVYGFPKNVQPFDCRDGMCDTGLIYPDLGIMLCVYVSNINEDNLAPQVKISSETIVYRIYFMEVGAANSSEYLAYISNSPVMHWKGYGTYP